MSKLTRLAPTEPLLGDPFWDLVQTAKRLQAPGGCAWDRAQTVQSLIPYLVEETWEAFCAARTRNRSHFQEELGDVLYTIVFLALVAQRDGWFDLESLLGRTREKMQRRHPHVFGTRQAKTAKAAYAYWQAAKRQESAGRSSSNPLRPLLVAVWEALRVRREARRALHHVVAHLEQPKGQARGWSRKSTARSRPDTGRA